MVPRNSKPCQLKDEISHEHCCPVKRDRSRIAADLLLASRPRREKLRPPTIKKPPSRPRVPVVRKGCASRQLLTSRARPAPGPHPPRRLKTSGARNFRPSLFGAHGSRPLRLMPSKNVPTLVSVSVFPASRGAPHSFPPLHRYCQVLGRGLPP